MTMIDALVEAQAKEAGWPKPEKEFRVCHTRRWRIDYFWPALSLAAEGVSFNHPRVALEIEGGVWTGGRHTRGAGFLKDCEKYNTLACMGIRLIRLTPQQVKKGELSQWLRRMA